MCYMFGERKERSGVRDLELRFYRLDIKGHSKEWIMKVKSMAVEVILGRCQKVYSVYITLSSGQYEKNNGNGVITHCNCF